jgi:hypothetical protein
MNIYGWNYEAVITSHYMAANGRMIGEWRRARDAV